jgi:N-acetyl-anhydromuramoyl-L-alanine amidase
MFEIDARSGLLKTVRFVPSPNCDARPEGCGIDVLVIHAISLPPGEFGGRAIEQLFCNCLDPDEHPAFGEIHDLEVSAHLLVRRDGEIVQFVPFHLRAWHAGQSSCEGRARVNDFSVGIELEGTDDVPFEAAQYQVLTRVTRALMATYPAISRERIYGHCHIAAGRKTDPGPHFDWKRYLTAV